MAALPGITFHEYGIGLLDGEVRAPCRPRRRPARPVLQP